MALPLAEMLLLLCSCRVSGCRHSACLMMQWEALGKLAIERIL